MPLVRTAAGTARLLALVVRLGATRRGVRATLGGVVFVFGAMLGKLIDAGGAALVLHLIS